MHEKIDVKLAAEKHPLLLALLFVLEGQGCQLHSPPHRLAFCQILSDEWDHSDTKATLPVGCVQYSLSRAVTARGREASLKSLQKNITA